MTLQDIFRRVCRVACLTALGAACVLALTGCATQADTVAAPAGEDARPPAASERTTAPPPAPEPTVTIAWQPSHQDDTGVDWHEYVVCGDIVDRVIALLPEYAHVKAWDTQHGLTGTNNYRPAPTNTPAFDAELAMANEASAHVFVSVHVDGGAPSGILGECMPGDAASRRLTEALVASVCAQTGLPNRGVREVRLYSLESERNLAPLRVLLELGDNAADRDLLMSEEGRDSLAAALAAAMQEAVPPDTTF